MFDLMNYYGKKRIPFFFIIDFDKKNIIVKKLEELKNSRSIIFNYNNIKNYENEIIINKKIIIDKDPVLYNDYLLIFNKIKEELVKGNSFLVNLTFRNNIKINLSLLEIFYISNAKYKLYYKNKFVFFSPEIFIRIINNKIYSYPMKGTINANIENAKELLLNNEKEFAEHITIVDLIRNDIGIVANKVNVEKFRYIDEIITNNSKLYQTSSIISGELNNNWNENIGTILDKLLPAGSISGAPKKKTVEIIKKYENYDRGFYTGISGLFDGDKLDSCVMIRFIEKKDNNYYYKSGGGITIYSNPIEEYNELIDKIYVPIA